MKKYVPLLEGLVIIEKKDWKYIEDFKSWVNFIIGYIKDNYKDSIISVKNSMMSFSSYIEIESKKKGDHFILRLSDHPPKKEDYASGKYYYGLIFPKTMHRDEEGVRQGLEKLETFYFNFFNKHKDDYDVQVKRYIDDMMKGEGVDKK